MSNSRIKPSLSLFMFSGERPLEPYIVVHVSFFPAKFQTMSRDGVENKELLNGFLHVESLLRDFQ